MSPLSHDLLQNLWTSKCSEWISYLKHVYTLENISSSPHFCCLMSSELDSQFKHYPKFFSPIVLIPSFLVLFLLNLSCCLKQWPNMGLPFPSVFGGDKVCCLVSPILGCFLIKRIDLGNTSKVSYEAKVYVFATILGGPFFKAHNGLFIIFVDTVIQITVVYENPSSSQRY